MNHGTIHTIRFWVGIIGNVISFFLFASPVPTFKRIYKNKSVEEFHPYTFLAGVFNCVMWIFYGTPKVHPDSTLIWTINSIGLVLYIIYLLIFVRYAPANKRWIVAFGFLIEIVVMAAIVFPTLLSVHTIEKRSLIVGTICVVFNIMLYASPLTIMWRVIKTKSNEFLPLWICVAGFANGLIWTTYALLQFDRNVLIGNGTGAFLGFCQILLYLIYRNPTKSAIDAEVQLQENKLPV